MTPQQVGSRRKSRPKVGTARLVSPSGCARSAPSSILESPSLAILPLLSSPTRERPQSGSSPPELAQYTARKLAFLRRRRVLHFPRARTSDTHNSCCFVAPRDRDLLAVKALDWANLPLRLRRTRALQEDDQRSRAGLCTPEVETDAQVSRAGRMYARREGDEISATQNLGLLPFPHAPPSACHTRSSTRPFPPPCKRPRNIHGSGAAFSALALQGRGMRQDRGARVWRRRLLSGHHRACPEGRAEIGGTRVRRWIPMCSCGSSVDLFHAAGDGFGGGGGGGVAHWLAAISVLPTRGFGMESARVDRQRDLKSVGMHVHTGKMRYRAVSASLNFKYYEIRRGWGEGEDGKEEYRS
ncbi:hypothetical protein DFH09DRAFT_1295853 [Mycena vulgaris]|nr:hypothetical protein DFH09DRAFT_1295853 [Mycena vulgaris]